MSNNDGRPVPTPRPATPGEMKGSQPDEMEWIRAAGNGDHEAFRMLVEKYQSLVAATVINMLGPGPESEDVGQDVFIRLYRALPKFRGESALGTYVTRIAMNLCLNEIRRRRRKTFLGIGRLADEDVADEAAEAVDGWMEAESKDVQDKVRAAVLRLGADHRAVVVLRWMEGYSTDDTADLLGIPKGTVQSRLHRALKEMREWLQP